MNQPPFSLANRIALVTGGSSGLGQHFAGTLARAGARVAVCARRADKLDEVVRQLEEAGHEALAIALDVTDPGSVQAGYRVIEERLGVVDVIINNAGIATSQRFLEQDLDALERLVKTNLTGSFLVAQEGARRLVQAGRPGSIVNIASILGQRVAGSTASYAASKAGLIQLGKVMALELARHGIRVNTLAPGYISTDLNRAFLDSEAGERLRARIPQRRFATPEALDGALLLLASEAGSYITGAVIAVDGGHLVSSL